MPSSIKTGEGLAFVWREKEARRRFLPPNYFFFFSVSDSDGVSSVEAKLGPPRPPGVGRIRDYVTESRLGVIDSRAAELPRLPAPSSSP